MQSAHLGFCCTKMHIMRLSREHTKLPSGGSERRFRQGSTTVWRSATLSQNLSCILAKFSITISKKKICIQVCAWCWRVLSGTEIWSFAQITWSDSNEFKPGEMEFEGRGQLLVQTPWDNLHWWTHNANCRGFSVVENPESHWKAKIYLLLGI